MNLLLDTHALLWWLDDSPSLSLKARDAIGEARNVVFVSAVTAWEISIKQALGKLRTPKYLERALAESHFEELPIKIAHAIVAGRLPRHHDDPFDRMLIAQAQTDRLTLVTHDARMSKYGTSVLWD
jgi:PIN domain nuclease of toxin-antitoxin system